MNDEDRVPVYVVRLSQHAAAQVSAKHDRLAALRGPDAAHLWEDKLMDEAGTLATLPARCPPAPEDALYQKVRPGNTLRALFFRPTRNGPVWRILFTIHEQSDDAPTVQVQGMLHGAQAPLTEWPAP